MFVIKYRKIFFTISGVLAAGSIAVMLILGLNLGIDFTGGTLIEATYEEERPNVDELVSGLESLGIENPSIQPTEDSGIIARLPALNEQEQREEVRAVLSGDGAYSYTEERFTSIGPVIGSELAQNALIALGIAVVVIVLFIAYTFRHVSEPVRSWKYGAIAIVALLHDILLPTGFFVLLGQFTSAQIDTLFVTALLAVLGISVNDTIVVFDRIRENLQTIEGKSFSDVVGISLRQTITRSINTSLTTLFVLLALVFFGPESTRFFALVLSVGLLVGTYSSIFLASPLLVALAPHAGRESSY